MGYSMMDMFSDFLYEHRFAFTLAFWFAAVLVLVSGITVTIERADSLGAIAGFEELRDAAQRLSCDPGDVRNAMMAVAVAEANSGLARRNEWNRHWYTDPFISDRWRVVRPIVICGSTER